MEYTFEKLADGDMYQVRLDGEFVTYTSYPDAAKMDDILARKGYESREDFFNQSLAEHTQSLITKRS